MDSENRFDREPIPPQTSGSFLPPDFKIPDLTTEGQYKFAEFPIDHQDLHLDGHVRFLVTPGHKDTPVSVELYAYNNQERVMTFDTQLYKSRWFFSTRKIEDPNFRRKGLGRRAILTLEDLHDKLAKDYPDFQFRSTVMHTRLGAVARMIIDQGWLKEHGLGQFATDPNLGYLPKKGEVAPEVIAKFLGSGKSEIEDALDEPPYTFEKPNPNYHE